MAFRSDGQLIEPYDMSRIWFIDRLLSFTGDKHATSIESRKYV